jgi:diguanylate cyclase (GGDEF)-like protein/PAS domain S-box-containing protein
VSPEQTVADAREVLQEIQDNLELHQRLVDAAAQLRLMESAVDQARDAIVVTETGLSTEARIRWCNLAFCELVGEERQDILGRVLVELPALSRVRRPLATALGRGGWEGHLNLGEGEDARHLEARVSAVDGGARPRHVAVLRDVTEKRKVEERLVHLAHHDVLTGLPNRKLLRDRLDTAVTRAQRYDERVAVLFVDLDGFKRVNDTLGHDAGDRVLQVVGERLRGQVRASDTVARIGGDEFVVLLPGVGSISNAERVARKVLSSIAEVIGHAGHEMFVTPSVGIALFPDHGRGSDDLLRHADQAMYQAKARGKATFIVWDPACSAEEQDRTVLVADLARALAAGEASAHLQPIVDATTGEIQAWEAHPRWTHPTRGRVSPAVFVPLLAEANIEAPFWAWIAQCTAAHAAARGQGVALDARAGWLAKPDGLEPILSVLGAAGVPPTGLWLEVHEAALLALEPASRDRLRAVRDRGVRVVVDHFGTGHLSVPQLRSLPLDAVKLDASLVRKADTDDALVRGVATLCHSLGLAVLADGVHDEATRDVLIRAGIPLQQGALWGGGPT